MNGPDSANMAAAARPGVNAGPNTAGAATPVNGREPRFLAPDADLPAYHARTRAAVDEVLSESEFADLHSDSYAAWRRLIEWIESIFSAIVSPLRKLPSWAMWAVIVWLVLALLAILAHLVYTLWRVLGGQSWAPEGGNSRPRHVGELLGIRELDFDLVYAEAGRLLKAGDWLAATKYLYVAAILWLDRQGCIAFRTSKTNRDYLTELRGRERLLRPFCRLTDGFEAIVYGSQPATGGTAGDMARTVEGLFHEPAAVAG